MQVRFPDLLLAASLALAGSAWAGPTMDALDQGGGDAMRAALEAGGDPHERGSIFRAPVLSLAAIRGDSEAVEALLAAGADPNQADMNGMNALSAAVRSCRAPVDLIRRLIDSGADLENRSGGELTPLLAAVQQERTQVALMLIAAGADINAVSIFGEGALNHAIYTRSPDVITALVERGADPEPLRLLYKTGAYYYPGFGARRPNAAGPCVEEREDKYPFSNVFGGR